MSATRVNLKRAQSILCISDSARADFNEFYRLSAGDRQRIKTLIPFDPSIEARVKARPIAPGERPRALLVNVLDPPKEFRRCPRDLGYRDEDGARV